MAAHDPGMASPPVERGAPRWRPREPGPFLACLAGLVLTVVAFAELPLLGALVGALLSGALAGLLAAGPRAAARAALLAGAGAVGLLALVALGGGSLLGLALATGPDAVVAVQGALLGLLPAGSAAGVARLAGRGPWPGASGPQPPGAMP